MCFFTQPCYLYIQFRAFSFLQIFYLAFIYFWFWDSFRMIIHVSTMWLSYVYATVFNTQCMRSQRLPALKHLPPKKAEMDENPKRRSWTHLLSHLSKITTSLQYMKVWNSSNLWGHNTKCLALFKLFFKKTAWYYLY